MKALRYTLLYMVLLLSTLMAASCHKDDLANDGVQPNSQPARRTVLVYMAAQNSLYQNAYNDSTEIMSGRQYIADDDRMLVFVDRGGRPCLYRVARQWAKPQIVKQWDDADFNSTDPQRFDEVIRYVKEQFPSREYGLVMWSHADGWIPAADTSYTALAAQRRPSSFGIDTGKNNMFSDKGTQMEVTALAQVLSQNAMHLKYIFFDACLMQNLEVDYALRNVADYVVASPMSIPGAGAYYTHQLRDGLFADDPSHIAKTYYEDVEAKLSSGYSTIGICISCVRTSVLDTLAQAMKECLGQSALAGRQSPDMSNVLAYQAYSSVYYYRPHNYDAYQTVQQLFPTEEAERLKSLIDSLVIAHYSTNFIFVGPSLYSGTISIPTATDNYRAVSMFVPQNIYAYNAALSRTGDLNEAFRRTEWYNAIGMSQTGW